MAKKNGGCFPGDSFPFFSLSGCAQVELAVKVAGDATIPAARLAVIVNDTVVLSQLKKGSDRWNTKSYPRKKENL